MVADSFPDTLDSKLDALLTTAETIDGILAHLHALSDPRRGASPRCVSLVLSPLIMEGRVVTEGPPRRHIIKYKNCARAAAKNRLDSREGIDDWNGSGVAWYLRPLEWLLLLLMRLL